jgi:2-keto-3-deoxy-L-rhamnonate aldolase RhmA
MMNGTLSIGTWLSVGSSAIADLAARCGLDWVLIDLEHGSASEAAVPDQLRALRGSPTKGIVRVGAPHADLIGRVLDWGAHGVMAPHVNSAAEAERIVQAAYYPPRGRRGYSRTVRAHDYGLRSPEESAPPMIFAQIETVEGVNHSSDVARVAGVDVLFVGPADLQQDIKHQASPAPQDFAQCLSVVVAAATAGGKQAGILLRDLAEVERYRDLGFAHVAVDSDLAILRKAWQQTVSKSHPL